MREIGRQAEGMPVALRVPSDQWRGFDAKSFASCSKGSRNSAPRCYAVVMAGGGELIGADGAFLERFVAVGLEH